MPIYLKLGDLKGNVTEKGHKEWIQVDSVQYGASREIRTEPGRAANRETRVPEIMPMSFTKKTDGSSLPLFKMAVGGTQSVNATIDFVKVEDNAQNVVLSIELKDVLVSRYDASAADDVPIEHFILNFTNIKMTHKTFDKSHKQLGAFTAGFDLVDAVAT